MSPVVFRSPYEDIEDVLSGKKAPKERIRCPGPNCEDHHEGGNRSWAADIYSGFCGINCREDFFSSIGAGDTRDAKEHSSHTVSFDELLYIKNLSSPA